MCSGTMSQLTSGPQLPVVALEDSGVTSTGEELTFTDPGSELQGVVSGAAKSQVSKCRHAVGIGGDLGIAFQGSTRGGGGGHLHACRGLPAPSFT